MCLDIQAVVDVHTWWWLALKPMLTCAHSGQGVVLTIDMYPCISWKVEGTNADMYVYVHRWFDFGLNVRRHTRKMLTWVEADAEMYIHANTRDVNCDSYYSGYCRHRIGLWLTIDMYTHARIEGNEGKYVHVYMHVRQRLCSKCA